jgi:serine/alanine adding enzyme
MKVVQTLEETAWRRFVDEHPQGNIFHTPEMYQVFVQAEMYTPTLWAVTDDHAGVLALLLPVQVAVGPSIGFLKRLTTRAVAYGSVLCAETPAGEQALRLLLQSYNRVETGMVLFTELRNLSDQSSIQPILTDAGYSYEEHLNFLVDLDLSPDEVMHGISARTRKKIRRGLRRGDAVVEDASQPEQIAECYELLKTTYGKAKVPLAHPSLFEAAYKVLHPKGMAKFLLVRVGDAYAASSVELIYKDVIYGWYGGMDREYSRYYPNELLTWDIFSWGIENGYRVYDFGGAGKPDEEYGVRDFKAKFGGELVCFGRNVKIHSPRMLRLSEYGYKIYRRFL